MKHFIVRSLSNSVKSQRKHWEASPTFNIKTTRKPNNKPLVLKPQRDNHADTHDRHSPQIPTKKYNSLDNNKSYHTSLIQSTLEQYNDERRHRKKVKKEESQTDSGPAASQPASPPGGRLKRKPHLDLASLIPEEYQYIEFPAQAAAPDLSNCPLPVRGCSQADGQTDACWTPVISRQY